MSLALGGTRHRAVQPCVTTAPGTGGPADASAEAGEILRTYRASLTVRVVSRAVPPPDAPRRYHRSLLWSARCRVSRTASSDGLWAPGVGTARGFAVVRLGEYHNMQYGGRQRTTRCCVLELVPHTGFEPVISALRGRCPGPLDECGADGPAARQPRPSGMIPIAGRYRHWCPGRTPHRRWMSRKTRIASATCWWLCSPITRP
jgi:hypothetical protein